MDQKNIRRRVYDALNVLMAMDIIAKDKKEIRWLGLPGQKNGLNSAKSSATTDAEIERQKSELRELEVNKDLFFFIRDFLNVIMT